MLTHSFPGNDETALEVNACISTLQEIRAKRQLDQISLLTRPRVLVVREGQEKSWSGSF